MDLLITLRDLVEFHESDGQFTDDLTLQLIVHDVLHSRVSVREKQDERVIEWDGQFTNNLSVYHHHILTQGADPGGGGGPVGTPKLHKEGKKRCAPQFSS